jgi:hypothetical protein
MYTLISYHTALLTECLNTYFTRIWTTFTMYVFMYYKIALLSKWLITHITNTRSLTNTHWWVLRLRQTPNPLLHSTVSMCWCVIKLLFSLHAFYKHHKYKGAHLNVTLRFKTALITECLSTHIKSIRALNTMHALMPYHTALLTECLITYSTRIWKLPTMYALMF